MQGNTRKGYKVQGIAAPTMGQDTLVINLAKVKQVKALASMPLIRDAVKHGNNENVTYKPSVFGLIFGKGK